MRISDWSSDVCSSDLEFYNSATFYLSHIKTEGRGGGWPDCTGGWEFDGVNACDAKYSYVTPQLLLVALAGDDTRLDDATVRHMVDNQVKGGWSSPRGPYKGAGQWWTERHRSEERRVGKEWGSTCRARGLPDH